VRILVLESLDVNTGCFVPHNLKDKVFTHFTADNIDINDSTLDGKNTFHATQMAAWQRGIGNGLQLDKLLPSSIVGNTRLIPMVHN
jgi:hypothetical protein